MTNRILRLMLVFALLANQAAICGAHTHHDSEPSDHSARSHVHLSGHSHDSDSHHHHESSDHQHPHDQQPISDFDSELDSSFPSDHDDDALFFGDQDKFQKQSNRTITKGFDSVSVFVVAEQPRLSKPTLQSQLTRAGPFSTYRCAIYLQTSRLLI